jgi:hypothetical protein
MAYIKFANGVIYGYEDDGAALMVRCYKLGDGFHRMSLEQMLAEPGGKYGPFFLEPSMPPLSPTAALVHGLLTARRNWRRGREAGEKWQPWRETGAWEYCFGDAAYQAWLEDLRAAESLPDKQCKAFFRCHSFTVYVLYDARLATASYLAANAGLLGDAATPHLSKAADIYRELGTSVRQLRHSIDAYVAFMAGDDSFDVRTWAKKTREGEMAVLAQARELDRAAFSELEQALTKAE